MYYNNNNGSGGPSDASYTGTDASHTFTISSTKPTRSGWTFKGWGTSSTTSTVFKTGGDTITISSDKTLYAVWESNSTSTTQYTYTLTYNANGGSGAPEKQEKTTDATSYSFTVSTTTPKLSGSTFLGWATSASATKATYSGGSTVELTSTNKTKTLYAVWGSSSSTSSTYTVKFNASGGSYTPSDITQNVGSSITLPSGAGKKTNYTFKGWADDSRAYDPSSSYLRISSGTVTLTAVWESTVVVTPTSYTIIIYSTLTGKELSRKNVTAGNTYTFPSATDLMENPYYYNDGYVPLGFSTSKTATTASINPGDTITPTRGRTYYLIYKEPSSGGATSETPSIKNNGSIRAAAGSSSSTTDYGGAVRIDPFTASVIGDQTLLKATGTYSNPDYPSYKSDTSNGQGSILVTKTQSQSTGVAVIKFEGKYTDDVILNEVIQKGDLPLTGSNQRSGDTNHYWFYTIPHNRIYISISGPNEGIKSATATCNGSTVISATGTSGFKSYLNDDAPQGTVSASVSGIDTSKYDVSYTWSIVTGRVRYSEESLSKNGSGTGLPSVSSTLELVAGGSFELNVTVKAKGSTVTEYTVSYDLNGGTTVSDFPSQTKTKGKSLTLHSKTPTGPSGGTFDHWSGNDGKSYSESGTYTTDADLVLTAVYSYTVTYNLNGGVSASDFPAQTKYSGTSLQLNTTKAPTNGSKVFSGWKGSNGTTYYTGTNYYTTDANLTLTAIWGDEPVVSKVTLTYHPNTDSGEGYTGLPSSETKDMSSSTYFTVSDNTMTRTKSGYTFAGWNTRSDGSGASYSGGSTLKCNQNWDLYAMWTKATSGDTTGGTTPTTTYYTLTYNANGGTGAPDPETNSTGSFTISSTEPTRDGYTFMGWSKDQYATSASYFKNNPITINTNTTLYAVWELTSVPKTSYTYKLTYNKNTIDSVTNLPASQTETVYSTSYDFAISSQKPIRSGYEFKGWSTNSGASNSVNVGNSCTVYSSSPSKTLYAVWKEVETTTSTTYTLTVNVKVNSSAWLETDCPITINGNTPDTWDSGKATKNLAVGTVYTISAKINNDSLYYTDILTGTLTGNASETVNYYSLTVTGGTGVSSTSGTGIYLYNQKASIMAHLESGYTFDTWTKSTGCSPANATANPTTVTMTARTVLSASANMPLSLTIETYQDEKLMNPRGYSKRLIV